MEKKTQTRVIAGNWKMNKLPGEAILFIKKLEPLVKNTEHEVVICVPYTDLFYTLMTTQGTNIKIGAQNVHWEDKGAYTGEISGPMLKSIGVEYVIIGHSERRENFGETDETVNKRMKAAIKNDLIPIMCIGENLKQKESGTTEAVLVKQLKLGLKGIKRDDVAKIIIAYEPIWAIGAGKSATLKDIKYAVKIIKDELEKKYGKKISEQIKIQYGGSMNASNAKKILAIPGIDGGLIGGASLDAGEFAKIILT